MDTRRLDILLERHRAGELSGAQEREVVAWLSTPEGRRRLEEMEAEDGRILRALPPASIAREIRRRDRSLRAPGSDGSRWTRWLPVPAGLAACAVLLFVLRPAPMQSVAADAPASRTPTLLPSAPNTAPSPTRDARAAPPSGDRPDSVTPTTPAEPALALAAAAPADPSSEGLRTKGDVRRLRVHRIEANGSATPLADGAPASAGDVLQIGLLPGARRWVAVVSVDGSGRTTRHIPETGESAIPAEGAVEAPHSFQLDAAPGFERFVLFTSDRPFVLGEAERILAQARGTRELHLPAGWSAESLSLPKPEKRP